MCKKSQKCLIKTLSKALSSCFFKEKKDWVNALVIMVNVLKFCTPMFRTKWRMHTLQTQIRNFTAYLGVVGCGEGVVYLASPGRPILAYSWARLAIFVAGMGKGGVFLFLLFLPFHSCSSFFPVRLFHLLYYLFYFFSPFLWETAQNDPQGLMCP